MPGFPSAAEAVYVGGGLWLRVHVLTLSEAMKGKDAIRVAVNIARGAMEPEQPPLAANRPERESELVAKLSKHLAAVSSVARGAVTGHAWSAVAEQAEATRKGLEAELDEQGADRYRQAAQVHAAALAAAGDDPEAIAAANKAMAAAIVETDGWLAGQHASLLPVDPGPAPSEWLPLVIVPNSRDEDRAAGKLCVAALDQVSTLWAYRVADVALRAAWEAQREVRPLSGSGRL